MVMVGVEDGSSQCPGIARRRLRQRVPMCRCWLCVEVRGKYPRRAVEGVPDWKPISC